MLIPWKFSVQIPPASTPAPPDNPMAIATCLISSTIRSTSSRLTAPYQNECSPKANSLIAKLNATTGR